MRKFCRLVIHGGLFLGLVLSPMTLEARETGDMARLAAAIERLADLYEEGHQQIEEEALARKLDTAIAYLNFRSRRIEMLEQDLHALRASRDRMETFIVQMNEKRQLAEAARTSSLVSNSELERQRQEQELTLRILRERIDRTERDIVLLENKIQTLMDELSSVESFVQRHLQF